MSANLNPIRSAADVRLERNAISIGRFFSVNFQRTPRLPNDGREYPLPPGFGPFPLRAVAEFSSSVPSAWRERGGFLLPMHQHEAMWLSFDCSESHPVAVRVEVGGVCALTGLQNAGSLSADPQNYMVAPDQPWLDGIKAGEGTIRQFVAAPLGDGVTIEGQLTGDESVGGFQLTVVDAKRGRFPEQMPDRSLDLMRSQSFGDEDFAFSSVASHISVCESRPMGLGAGGRMTQKIYGDDYGIDTWDAHSAVTVHIHLVDARDWRSITGEAPPASPVSVETYKSLKLPWFELDDFAHEDLPVSPILAKVKPISFE